MGSCFAGKHCRAGHPMNPFMLWDFHGNGVLSQDDPDTWRVGGMTLDRRATSAMRSACLHMVFSLSQMSRTAGFWSSTDSCDPSHHGANSGEGGGRSE